MATKDTKEVERQFLLEVIEVYKSLPMLWKIKSNDYSNRNKKNAAYEELLEKFREKNPDATLDDLKKKLNCLRTNFRKELKKVNDSTKSGTGAEDVYQPGLWYFEAMLFLKDQETPAESTSSIRIGEENEVDAVIGDNNPVDSEEVSETQTTGEEVRTPVPPTRTMKRRKITKDEAKRDEFMALVCNRLKQPEDENLSVAKTWAREISQMHPQQQLFAKKAINDVLFEGRCGTLHRNSVEINAHCSSTPLSCMNETSFSPLTATPSPIMMVNNTGSSFIVPINEFQQHTAASSHQSENSNITEYFATFDPTSGI